MARRTSEYVASDDGAPDPRFFDADRFRATGFFFATFFFAAFFFAALRAFFAAFSAGVFAIAVCGSTCRHWRGARDES